MKEVGERRFPGLFSCRRLAPAKGHAPATESPERSTRDACPRLPTRARPPCAAVLRARRRDRLSRARRNGPLSSRPRFRPCRDLRSRRFLVRGSPLFPMRRIFRPKSVPCAFRPRQVPPALPRPGPVLFQNKSAPSHPPRILRLPRRGREAAFRGLLFLCPKPAPSRPNAVPNATPGGRSLRNRCRTTSPKRRLCLKNK